MNDWHSMRASDADRERAADDLKAALAEGRLTFEDYHARLDQLMRAGTYGEIQPLTADLPSSGTPPPHRYAGAATPYPAPPRPTHQTTQPNGPSEPLATAALVLGVLAPFTIGLTSIPAVVTGHLALRRIHRSGSRGHGLAVAGLAIGYVFLSAWCLFWLLYLIGVNSEP
jgi:hypothetical protein